MAMDYPLLRLTQSALGDGRYKVETSLEVPGQARLTAVSEFKFALSDHDQRDLHWYLEDYLQAPYDPAPTIAAGVEKRIAEIGTELFREIFHSSDDARDLWAVLRANLDDTRVEIATGVQEAAAIAWELIRDPKTDVPLALRAQAFVRTHSNPAQQAKLPPPPSQDGPVRILLVICRPGADEDVPFRSVASRLVKALTEEARQIYQLDVLRPPTFQGLAETLRRAKDDRKPYHVVHFDGHGVYLKAEQANGLANVLKGFSTVALGGARQGAHGFLAFENPGVKENLQLVGGPALGALLAETRVPLLVLNACRSAHAEPVSDPKDAKDAGGDVHAQVRAYGSLAQEVMDAGVAGVVAMRYNVYVVTAGQFVADLYAALLRGQPLGEAATMGRKQLAASPMREIAYEPRALADWPVPVVYEAAPLGLFPPRPADAKLKIDVKGGQSATARGALDEKLPPPPDVGFYGRDETLLALDRAFDSHNIVLLHALAGAGKTAAVSEFARWYDITGGIGGGPVLFTSFEHYEKQKNLARVLDAIGQVFGPWMESLNPPTHWLALDDAARRQVALQVLRQIPVLWIWDNVEPVAGFPAGTPSAWSDAEQQELADFLRAARPTKAKFLLTTRRDERAWLGDLPKRITLPPMPMHERVQLARAIAERHGQKLSAVNDWRPLLRFTQGNPLTVTVLVGQALRKGLKSREEIEAFVARLRAGEAAFEDEASEGRSKSLGASLSYGFEDAFSDSERKQLAVLHLFQGFVDVDALKAMGHPEASWCLPALTGLTREDGVSLLDKAAEIGLLTRHGRGYYSIHPALPWFFRTLFEQYYPKAATVQGASPGDDAPSALRAYVEAVGGLGDYYHNEYEGGNRDVIAALRAEEANLLHARRFARENGWWDRVTSTMQGLRALYGHTGRRAEWKALVEEIVPDFIDPKTDGPLPGREEKWSLVTGYRIRLAMEARDWAEAERIERIAVAWNRRRAAEALSKQPDKLSNEDRNAIRSIAIFLEILGIIQSEQGSAECVKNYEEAMGFFDRIGAKHEVTTLSFNLGNAYKNIPSLRNLDEAEKWYRRGLDLHDKADNLGRAKCVCQLGLVAHERFIEDREAKRPKEELLRYINDAAGYYLQSLDLTPSDAVDDLAVAHNQLGAIYADAGNLDRALHHWRESIRYCEETGNEYAAAGTRANVGLALARAGRFPDALEYAKAAMRGFEPYGHRAAADVEKTQGLIAEIEQAAKAKQNESGGGS